MASFDSGKENVFQSRDHQNNASPNSAQEVSGLGDFQSSPNISSGPVQEGCSEFRSSPLNSSGLSGPGSTGSRSSFHNTCMSESNPLHSTGQYGSGSNDSFGHTNREEGYDLDFVVRDEKYDCPICLLVLREPFQTQCGHRFCQRCILRWIRDSDKRCPIDNTTLSENMLFPDNFAKREILVLEVKCPNSKEGCTQIEILKNLQKHLSQCQYKVIPCPNQCSHILLRKDLPHHLEKVCLKRDVLCSQCQTPVPAELMGSHLENECARGITECSHCGISMMREQIAHHVEVDCMKVCVDCSFRRLGCTASNIQRGEMGKHRQDQIQFHMNLMCKALIMIIDKMNVSHANLPPQNAVTTTSSDSREIHNAVPANTLADLTRNMQETMATLGLVSPPVASSLPAIGIPPLVQGASALAVSSESPFVLNRPADDTRTLSGQTKEESVVDFTSEPSVQQEGAIRVPYDRVEFQSMKDQNALQDESLARHEQDLDRLQHKVETVEKNNLTLYKRVKTLENTISEFEGRSCNGLYVWKVKNYSKFRREAEMGETTAIHSPAFYSSYYGYKLCIRANLNGVDSAIGTHLSIFIHFMQGEFDDILDWPFSGRIMLTVLDQNQTIELRQHVMETFIAKPNLAAFQKPVTPRNHKGFGYMEYLPLTILDNSTYVKSDTLIIKCHVIQTN